MRAFNRVKQRGEVGVREAEQTSKKNLHFSFVEFFSPFFFSIFSRSSVSQTTSRASSVIAAHREWLSRAQRALSGDTVGMAGEGYSGKSSFMRDKT